MSDVLLNKTIEMNKEIGRIGEIVKRHDDETFPRIIHVLDEQTKALARMESKQNGEYTKMNSRIEPLEKDYLERQESKKDVRNKLKGMFWELVKISAVAVFTYLLIRIKPAIKFFINHFL